MPGSEATFYIHAASTVSLTFVLLYLTQWLYPRSSHTLGHTILGDHGMHWHEKAFGTNLEFIWNLIKHPKFSTPLQREIIAPIAAFFASKTLSTVLSHWLSSVPQLLSQIADLLPPSLTFWRTPPPAPLEDDLKYQGGEDYADSKELSTSLSADLKAIGLKAAHGDLHTLLETAFSSGKPVDDKKMTMEKLIGITASLPAGSKNRLKLTHKIIDGLWNSLQHPPLSYLGDQFEYRTPDGSNNNILYPNLGKAGTPYARTVRRTKRLHGVRPDPGLLFDMLQCRTPESFRENPAGISSVLFYHATIIVHDIFRTNRADSNISDTSSYLDLAPLYGSNLEDQLKVRTMEGGKLKPDTFSEKRLLAQPPGINVMLIMYSRFHNYVADILLKINEGGRFTLTPLPPTAGADEKAKAIAKQDQALFQTARLIVGGMYINICLHDYLRGLTNTHHSASTWALDPRIEKSQFDGEGAPRGVGNQVSAEFNLLYRFHSTISLRDEKWLEEFLTSLFPGSTKTLAELSPQELFAGLMRFEANTNPDPSKREFANLKRGADGKFNDEDLVRVMTASMEDNAGLFGARMVPKALRVVEILGTLQARKWQLASLNEFRDFFGLKRHETMEDINPDPEIASLLRNLYDHPDMVELYPGLFIEDAKPRLDPGCGGCPPYTVGRAVFSDAITLVRADRFNTLDYTPATLTNWGMQEVQQNYRVLAGSMFYKLFQRAFPGWYPYNSLHIMQPMFTWKMNKQIAEELGTIKQYSLAGPSAPKKPIIVVKHSLVTKILKDQNAFRVPWKPALNDLFPGKKDYSGFMLGGDAASNAKQRALLGSIMYAPREFSELLMNFVTTTASSCLKATGYELSKGLNQIDIIRDIAIPVNTMLLADLFSLDLKGPQNPKGSLSMPDLYKHLLNVRIWGFNNNDPGLAFCRRMWAQDAATVLTSSTKAVIERAIYGEPLTLLEKGKALVFGPSAQTNAVQLGSLRWYGQHIVRELMKSGQTIDEATDLMWLTALAGVGVIVGLLADVMQFYLKPENAALWQEIQTVVLSNSPAANTVLRQYVLEAQRLTSPQRNLRICASTITIDGQTFNPGDQVVCLLGPACKDPTVVSEPNTFKLNRPADNYIHFGYGPHECLGREIGLTYVVGIIKVLAGLKNLRPAPGDMGLLKSINVGTEKFYLNDSWSWLTFDPTTWKLHYEGDGKGTHFKPGSVAGASTSLPAALPVTPASATPATIPAGTDKDKDKSVAVPQTNQQPTPPVLPGGTPSGAPLPGTPAAVTPGTSVPVTNNPQPVLPGGPPSGGAPPDGPSTATPSTGVPPPSDWFFGPDSKRDPAKEMPSHIQPPTPGSTAAVAPTPTPAAPAVSSAPSTQNHEWFFGPDSKRDPTATMPTEIHPPPVGGAPATPAAPNNQIAPEWFFGEESKRDPAKTMPAEIHPPPVGGAPATPAAPSTQDHEWFFGPDSKRDPTATMPTEIHPPPVGGAPATPAAPNNQSTPEWFFGPDSKRDTSKTMPAEIHPPPIGGVIAPTPNGQAAQSTEWFFGPDSKRDPTVTMPTHIQPPGPGQIPVVPSDSTEWFFGPNSKREAGRPMEQHMLPPTPGGNLNGNSWNFV